MSELGDRRNSAMRDPRQRAREISMVQNVTLVWLDANIDLSNEDFQHSLTQLRRTVTKINTFTNVDPCLDFIQSINDIRVFLIISGALGQTTMPRIHHLSNIDSVYVFCSNKAKHEQWAGDWAKIAGVFNKIDQLCKKLKQDAELLDRTTIPISITTSDLSHIEPSFMYTQLIKEILLEMDYDDKAMGELITTCRQAYQDSKEDLRIIDDFQRDYARHSPIWWYTRECFTYRMLNQALRNQDVDILIKMGFFLRDLHRQIKHLHSKGKTSRDRFIVYRGQGLSTSDFEKIKSSRNGLISFNSFLSTSFDKEVSTDFARQALRRSGTVGVVFRMSIDPSISTTPFVSLKGISYYGGLEEELLFSMHTVFRIGNVESIDGCLWKITLTLCTDAEDEKLHQLTEAMRKQTAGSTPWHQLASLLLETGDYDKAEKIYHVLLLDALNTRDVGNLSFLYNQLGFIEDRKGEYAKALEYMHKALDIYVKSLPPTHPNLATTYSNIGGVYQSMGEYSKALEYMHKDLDICLKSLPPTHPDLATTYSKIGGVYHSMREYSKALEYMHKALDIYVKSLPPTHPDLATTYSNIGPVYQSMGEYSKALEYMHKALDIYVKSLPPTHPDLATTYSQIGGVYDSMGEYSKALQYMHKALDIRVKSLPPTHPNLATTYSKIGGVYDSMGEYSKALQYMHKALDIRVKSLPPTHPNLATTYSKIGGVYHSMREYSKALEYHHKDLDICLKSLPPTHPDLATTYSNIGGVYQSMGEYSKALEYQHKALDIRVKSLPPTHPDLATTYSNIGPVYQSMGEYSKALEYHHKALDIRVKSLPPTHPYIAISHFYVGCVHEKMGDRRKARASMEVALKIAESSLPATHPDMETYRKALKRVRQNC